MISTVVIVLINDQFLGKDVIVKKSKYNSITFFRNKLRMLY